MFDCILCFTVICNYIPVYYGYRFSHFNLKYKIYTVKLKYFNFYNTGTGTYINSTSTGSGTYINNTLRIVCVVYHMLPYSNSYTWYLGYSSGPLSPCHGYLIAIFLYCIALRSQPNPVIGYLK